MFTDGLVLFLKLSFVVLELRSGLAWKHSTDVGNKIAQLILEKIVTLDVMEVKDLDATRTEGGLSSRSFGYGEGLSFLLMSQPSKRQGYGFPVKLS
ncbi:hypothetical protein POTOM_048812 [Populus tomentosa]|uniref:Uncharacterized protein n=1 Tax=Populus tomentosa TaxID=118781 RepID=A0A8X7YEX2_POPTO|nr:hypothetical protein POTOM_048812 [Populus tomentosa]